ncbi:thiopeptide-type bacteriocin biosynthesis protein [Streptomyces sp. NBC_01186]|uniref:thiopeptide-type bacteriocin biosynthesis protein n=1 Tax=Streptomyces sp. NBC_01186 TaxID=2903765 RepID=UPI002E0D62DC|nr:thiopeptide-type bacteriocin biosynthesis protein [Streptomyces sp. NBC_01186]
MTETAPARHAAERPDGAAHTEPHPEAATPLNADDRSPAELRLGEWLSAHVYYSADRDSLLSDCVRPLFARLRGEGLADGCYFLRYWLEGTHVRLRIRPVSLTAVPALTSIVEEEVGAYLRRCPSSTDPAVQPSDAQYREHFLLEFSEAQWNARYGPGTTRMPRRPDNSLAYLGYEPELERYGGSAGVAIAEWHAEHSSDLVLGLLASPGIRTGSGRLGTAAQLMATLALSLLEDTDRAVAFLAGRMADWEAQFQERHDTYDAAYRRMAGPLGDKVEALHAGVLGGRPELLTGFLRRWAEHGAELRARIDEAAERGELAFPIDGTGAARPVGPQQARRALLAGFTHMMCNRLGVTLGNEDYLVYVLHRALTERVQGATERGISAT